MPLGKSSLCQSYQRKNQNRFWLRKYLDQCLGGTLYLGVQDEVVATEYRTQSQGADKMGAVKAALLKPLPHLRGGSPPGILLC